MIRKEDLLEAIAECEGQRHPTASTCIKLASYYAILRQMEGEGRSPEPVPKYSFEAAPVSETEFARLAAEKGYDRCIPILDEAMQVLFVVNPKMHEGIMRKLRSI